MNDCVTYEQLADLARKFKNKHNVPLDNPPQIYNGDFALTRIEGTQFSIAEHFGGCIVGGRIFKFFLCAGGEKVIMRNDFKMFVHNELTLERMAKRKKAEENQLTLGL